MFIYCLCAATLRMNCVHANWMRKRWERARDGTRGEGESECHPIAAAMSAHKTHLTAQSCMYNAIECVCSSYVYMYLHTCVWRDDRDVSLKIICFCSENTQYQIYTMFI